MGDCFESGEPEIPKFFSGRSVFITGGTGLMGKVLIERLLSTCPNIEKLYLLIRHKKNSSPEERLIQLKQCQVFDDIRQKCPRQLDKLFVISGDATKTHLGLPPKSFEILRNVSIVFHSAASVKFDEPLRVAVDNNLRSVIQLLEICDILPNLELLVYVSTAYCNAELSRVEEKVYPSPKDLNKLLNFVQNTPETVLEQYTKRYIKPKPNTYTFTKAMAESVIAEHTGRKYAAAIFRPTIVTSSLKHPFPGWMDNYNGPTGIAAGHGKGVLHVTRVCPKKRADLLPVDLAIDTLIAVAWETATEKPVHVRVYNCSTNENPTTYGSFKEGFVKYLKVYPLEKPIWYPYLWLIKNRHVHNLLEMLLQTLPLYTAEYIVRFLGIRKSLNFIVMSQKLSSMSEALSYFATREWDFEITNYKQLRNKLSKADAAIFNLDPNSIIWDDFYRDFSYGIRKYLIKREDKYLAKDRQYLKLLWFLHYSLETLTTIIIFMKIIGFCKK